MKKLITSNLGKLIERKFSLKKQENNNATYYPKRSPENSCIDWESDIFQIEAFIRAVTRPFNGAFSFINKEKVIIWRASIFETDLVNYDYLEDPIGTILEVFLNDKFLVKCRGGILLVHEFNSNIKISKGKKLFSPSDYIKFFIRNRFGFYDC